MDYEFIKSNYIFAFVKKLLFFLLISVGLNAQQGISYQAIAKDLNGNIIKNSNVSLKFTIQEVQYTGAQSSVVEIYVEEHNIDVPSDGVINLTIGTGQKISGIDWYEINWMKNIQYIEEINFGAGYQNLGIKKFTSVPYSNYSFASQHVYMDFPKMNFYVGANESTTGKATRTIAFGIGSGYGIEGEDNVSIGISNSSRLKGSENVAIGSNSMAGGVNFASTHYGNGVYGNPNINSNEISDRNTAVGFNSMNAIDGGYQNSSFGWNSMNSNTGGFKNTAIGSHSLAVNTIGNINTAIGEVALHWNLDGDNNTAVGHGALFANTSGNENTAVGTSALNNLEEDYNVGIGKFAGTSLISGTLNTALGYRSDISNNLNNATAIGANATVTASNTIQLGNTNVTLVNTSGVVSATGFKGSGDEITLTDNGAVISLVSKISELENSSSNSVNLEILESIILRGISKNSGLNQVLISNGETVSVYSTFTSSNTSLDVSGLPGGQTQTITNLWRDGEKVFIKIIPDNGYYYYFLDTTSNGTNYLSTNEADIVMNGYSPEDDYFYQGDVNEIFLIEVIPDGNLTFTLDFLQ